MAWRRRSLQLVWSGRCHAGYSLVDQQEVAAVDDKGAAASCTTWRVATVDGGLDLGRVI